MTLRFSYQQVKTSNALMALLGRPTRARPVIPVTLIGPAGAGAQDGVLAPAAHETVSAESRAAMIGSDLTNALSGAGAGVGTAKAVLRYAEVTLRVARPGELREWRAWVAFTAAPLVYPALGISGFLQFFDVDFFGAREEVE